MRYLLERWSDLSYRDKGFFLVAIPAAALLIVACAAYVLTSQGSSAGRSAYSEFRTLAALERMKTSETSASAAIQGFFLTREQHYVLTERKAITQFDANRQEALALTAGNRSQQQRLELTGAIQLSRDERIFAALERFRSGRLDPQALGAIVLADEGERLRIEKVIDGMQAEETLLSDANQRHAGWLRGCTMLIIGVCLCLGLWGAIAMPQLVASGFTVRIATLSEAVSRLATGASLDPLPGGHDEIGALSAGVGRAAVVLRQKTMAIENASHGIAMVDVRGACLWCNRVYLELTGLSRGNECGTVVDAVDPRDQGKLDQALEHMRATGRGETEVRMVPPGRESIDVSITCLSPCDAPESGYYIFLLDISAQKHVDAELIRAKDAAVAANAAKSTFLAKISHEIRTPMNAILGAADLLSESPLEPDQAEYVRMFQRNCRRLVSLINDFLDFAKIEAGAMRLDKAPFRVRQTVHDAVETFRETALRKGVALEIDIADAVPEWQLGDSQRVQQVLMNLVSNALKFTSRGAVRVRAFVSGGAGPLLRFSVCDTGPGIRPEDRQQLFLPFTQLVHTGAAQVPGSGLGLTICREIVQMMGGEISVASQVGVGSTFSFTIPLHDTRPAGQPVPAAQGKHRAPFARPMRNLRLLIAEDGPDNRLLLQHYLKNEPIAFQFAENGQLAVDAILAGEAFDLILMDLDMPVLSGIDAVRRIHDWQLARAVPRTPILAFSAHAIRDLMQASLDAGCVAHITKPVDRSSLLDDPLPVRARGPHPKHRAGGRTGIPGRAAGSRRPCPALPELQVEAARGGECASGGSRSGFGAAIRAQP